MFLTFFLYILPLLSPPFLLSITNMNNYGDANDPSCDFHPKEAIVGICALCLRERLLNLASKQGSQVISKDSNRSFRLLRRRPIIALPKVFALSTFLHRFESRQQKPDDYSYDQSSIASLDDSFISIEFDENGQASTESKKAEITVKPRGMLRWQKKAAQLLQLARWKRSGKVGGTHVGIVGKAEGGRRWWIRSLTRRRSTTS